MRKPTPQKAKMLLCALAALALSACAVQTGADPVPEYVFTYAENQAADYPTALAAQRFADLVHERTDGRIKINVYADSAFGTEPSVFEQLQYGGIDFARLSVMTFSDDVPVMNVVQLPYLYEDADHMWRVLDGEIGSDLLAELDGSGIVGLSWFDAGARHFYTDTGPIETPEDMQGLRIRVAESTMMADMVRALGATPVTVTYSEVYSMLETDTIDGAENNWPSYESKNHWQLAPYITLDAHTRNPELQVCSQSTWDVLSEADREILRACAQESALYERELWNEAEEESCAALVGKCVVTELDEDELALFRAAVEPVYEKYASGYTAYVRRIARAAQE